MKTNLSKNEIINLVSKVVTKGIPEINQYQLPTRDEGKGKIINEIYYFVPNTLLQNVTAYHNLIYPESEYIPSEYVKRLSDKLTKYLY